MHCGKLMMVRVCGDWRRRHRAHGLFWKNGTDAEGSILDSGATYLADPFFTAIDAGTATFAWPGKLVLSVPRGDVPDLGAFESDPAKAVQSADPNLSH